MKTCSSCEEEKVFSEFSWRTNRNTWNSHCKACHRAKYRDYKARRPDAIRERAWRDNGIDMVWSTFEAMVADCDGKCEICGRLDGTRLHVDHDHATGAIRGLLCGLCNRGIGLLGDDWESLRRAATYLRTR